MTRKLFVICGHGAGDPGACANGYQEAERVRKLGKRIKELGGDRVVLGDTSRNWYADAGINSLNYDTDDIWIVELHMDSAAASARGAHVIICGQFAADEWDEALAAKITAIFPGRSTKIAKRNDLANPNRAAARGFNYRLVENGFISNAEDLATFNSRIDDIAKAYLEAFGITASGGSSSSGSGSSSSGGASGKKTVSQLAKEVIEGKWGNGDARKSKLEAAGYDYSAVQAKVNEMLGASGSKEAKKSVSTIAKEVIAGEWGNGNDRKKKLEAAGYDYDDVQAEVNRQLGVGSSSSPSSKSWKVGTKVKVTNPVDENGTHLAVSGTYTIMEISGNRVVIGKGGVVTAAMPKGNLALA